MPQLSSVRSSLKCPTTESVRLLLCAVAEPMCRSDPAQSTARRPTLNRLSSSLNGTTGKIALVDSAGKAVFIGFVVHNATWIGRLRT